ncbi:hypothetical protein K443DRAFT_677352 [Laccaria amethystina LaAM-08-1]|uniref:NAD(P)-binding protein n=1 Tax=Laccaria amethystina LaAM-08-1 TaxID=1095629 RepID=A0A0C9XMK6_9AGAR|nr:hypothetical protein K443DRAFT_677352 [Laccaria amethystina LaAM-08-1]
MSLPQLNSLSACHKFLITQPASEIASQLLRDQDLCRSGGVPSPLVYCLPHDSDHIIRALNDADLKVPMPIARMRFASIVSGIKSYLVDLPSSESTDTLEIPEHMIPTDADFNAALKVLAYLRLPQIKALPDSLTPLREVTEVIQTQLLLGSDLRNASRKKSKAKRRCYMCRYNIHSPHKFYAALCNPCGEFNISSSELSLPPNLDLKGKAALVTGGRVNLGYHTALRLLRCGANVVVSTRYPFDAQTRYFGEEDAEKWKGRLKIVGADFRTAKDVLGLVKALKSCLEEWAAKGDVTSHGKLNILVNNAAQTLTDAVEAEGQNILLEEGLSNLGEQGVVVDANYRARVRGGVQGYHIELPSREGLMLESAEGELDSKLAVSVNANALGGSSWVQRINEIPYEDVVSALSVNTFVPFILLRELLPLMSIKSDALSVGETALKPSGYVINVSSREGVFENEPKHGSKAGRHVHTNMSKAALNMLTETEASTAWVKCKVAVNSVDPGYMSADLVWQEMVGRKGEKCPIGWEDGAGRVLWPIAEGEKGEVIWGRFLKHFREVETGPNF